VKVKREKGGTVGRKRLGLEREGREENVWVWQRLFFYFFGYQNTAY
jgi:hypothetical protein